MQGLRVFASAKQPGGDGGLPVAENTLSSRRIQSFSQRRQHNGDLLRRGFQTVQGRVAPGSERGSAGLAAERLDLLNTPMFAIPDESMDSSISDAKVPALSVRTGEAFGIYAFGSSRRLFTSHQGRTCTGAGTLADEAGEARRQAGQSV